MRSALSRSILLFAAGLSSAIPAAAQPLSAGAECGGDAFSSAQVIEHRPPRRGPLAAVPDTLCADLEPRQPRPELRIDAYPVPSPVPSPQDGGGPGRVPYEGRSPRPSRP